MKSNFGVILPPTIWNEYVESETGFLTVDYEIETGLNYGRELTSSAPILKTWHVQEVKVAVL